MEFFLAGLIATILSGYAFIKLAKRINFVDTPDETRKLHKNAVPPVGGLSIFVPFLVILFFADDGMSLTNWEFYAAALILLVTGALDDAFHISAKIKFFIHFVAAILIVVGGANLVDMGNLFGYGSIDFGVFATIFSICCVVYLINAMNMMDGLDGLAGGLSLVITAALVIACAFANIVAPVGLVILLGGLLGYLWFNMRTPLRSRAVMFLGDAGSMTIGLVMAWYAMRLSQAPYHVIEPMTVAWILALPIWDAFGLFTARLREGRHPFEADRRHFHHHFIEAGFTSGQAVPFILLYAAFLAGIGIVLPVLGVPVWILTYLWIALWLGHAQLSFKPNSFIRFLRRIHVKWFSPKQHPNHGAP